MVNLRITYAIFVVGILINTPLLADTISGEANPCQNSKQQYSYCRTNNFPYVWRWSINSDAVVKELGTNANCYLSEVSIGKKSATLTFHQSNPPGQPQLQNVTKQINPKKCEAPSKASEIPASNKKPIAEIKANWSEFNKASKEAHKGFLEDLYIKHKQFSADKNLALNSSVVTSDCSYVYWGCGSCPGGWAQVDAYCGSGSSQPDYSSCTPC